MNNSLKEKLKTKYESDRKSRTQYSTIDRESNNIDQDTYIDDFNITNSDIREEISQSKASHFMKKKDESIRESFDASKNQKSTFDK